MGKFIIALIVGRNGHHGARPVSCQDIIGDVDGNFFFVDGINGVSADKNATLLLIKLGSFKI